MSALVPIEGKLTVSSDMALIGLLGDWVATLSQIVPGADEVIELELNARLVLTELFTNSVRHAYRDDPDGRVEISFKGVPGHLEIEVSDYGPGCPRGFDVGRVKLPEQNQIAESGRGLFLVRQLVSSISYQRDEDLGKTTFHVELPIPEHDELLQQILESENADA